MAYIKSSTEILRFNQITIRSDLLLTRFAWTCLIYTMCNMPLVFGQRVSQQVQVDTNTTMHDNSALIGSWELVETMFMVDDDSTIKPATIQLWADPGAKPLTSILIDSNGHFIIDQACLKCPYLHWEGRCAITTDTTNQATQYIRFIDRREDAVKKQKHKSDYVLEFDGYILQLSDTELVIQPKDGTKWRYIRV